MPRTVEAAGLTRKFLPVPFGWRPEMYGLSIGQRERDLYGDGTDIPAVRLAILADHFRGSMAPPAPLPSSPPPPLPLPPVQAPEPVYAAPPELDPSLLADQHVAVEGLPGQSAATPEFQLKFCRRKWRRVRITP